MQYMWYGARKVVNFGSVTRYFRVMNVVGVWWEGDLLMPGVYRGNVWGYPSFFFGGEGLMGTNGGGL